MTTVTWNCYNNANCTSFNVYRAIPGITITFGSGPNVGDVLTFAATSPTVQNITFTSTSIGSFVSTFNAHALGAKAYLSNSGTQVFIRATAQKNAKLTIFACTAATSLSITPGTVVSGLAWKLINNTVRTADVFSYEYVDNDGQIMDLYQITSVSGSAETFPTFKVAPLIADASLCVIEGRLTNSQNLPLVGAKVQAKISTPMEKTFLQGLDDSAIVVKTDAYGRFSMALTRCKVYLFQIPDVSYNESIVVPNRASINFLKLRPTLEDRFSPYED